MAKKSQEAVGADKAAKSKDAAQDDGKKQGNE